MQNPDHNRSTVTFTAELPPVERAVTFLGHTDPLLSSLWSGLEPLCTVERANNPNDPSLPRSVGSMAAFAGPRGNTVVTGSFSMPLRLVTTLRTQLDRNSCLVTASPLPSCAQLLWVARIGETHVRTPPITLDARNWPAGTTILEAKAQIAAMGVAVLAAEPYCHHSLAVGRLVADDRFVIELAHDAVLPTPLPWALCLEREEGGPDHTLHVYAHDAVRYEARRRAALKRLATAEGAPGPVQQQAWGEHGLVGAAAAAAAAATAAAAARDAARHAAGLEAAANRAARRAAGRTAEGSPAAADAAASGGAGAAPGAAPGPGEEAPAAIATPTDPPPPNPMPLGPAGAALAGGMAAGGTQEDPAPIPNMAGHLILPPGSTPHASTSQVVVPPPPAAVRHRSRSQSGSPDRRSRSRRRSRSPDPRAGQVTGSRFAVLADGPADMMSDLDKDHHQQ
ncbi:hypothetical protein TSOC_007871 [Tetrabaena socialis]|uniref:Uncharacterized protein n=1 Tax=Tetrabaena socialis TaxID=47790 RepID=A0A2J8A000_9CHLO|nr:hypothetical protein TSOC_007871 [Tetrabaena socialis]|eukprot:PNH05835.1 hypothetical protein TSOC_007871 [Tetrabaena socialis]